MIIAIIAGGSGTRLWPLSTPKFPKHLLAINDDDKSLLQKTYDRAKLLSNKIYVITEKSHVSEVENQLKDLSSNNIIVEPGRRGTANCIIKALIDIQKKEDPKEAIAFVHADQHIRDNRGFKYTFNQIEKISKNLDRLILVGVEPNYPATGFGYIKKGNLISDLEYVYGVESFKEKPDYKKAKEYYKSGDYLWNCGYFVANSELFLNLIEKYSPNLYNNYLVLKKIASKKDFDHKYLQLKPEAIDYALIEKIPNLAVYPANFDWMDLGTYRDLSIAVGSDEKGNYVSGLVYDEEIDNSFICNKESKPLVVIGLDNVVVINTKDGVLVARKDLSQKIGDISKIINENKK